MSDNMDYASEELLNCPEPASLRTTLVSCIEKLHPVMFAPMAQKRNMTAQECEEAASLLADYAGFMQREYNRLQSHIDRCEDKLRFVKPRSKEAMDLHRLLAEYRMRATLITDFPARLEAMARSYSNLARRKVKQHG